MKRLDRRALFASGAAAALLAATGTSVAQTPKRGGMLRIAVPRENALFDRVLGAAVCDQLTEVASDGVLRGELAQDWNSDATARHWKFTLRDDSLGHDGGRFGATDAVASLEAHLVQGRLDLGAGAVLQALGEDRVQIALQEGDPHLPYKMAGAGLILARGGQVDAPAQALIGSGIYRVERAQEGRHFRLRRQESHYKDGRAGWFDAVEVIVIPDPLVRAEALRDGYVDVAALPAGEGLLGRGTYFYHPSADDIQLAAAGHVVAPARISPRSGLDDGRIAERWWMA